MRRIVICVDCDDAKADEAVRAAAEAVECVGVDIYRAYRDSRTYTPTDLGHELRVVPQGSNTLDLT